jgi:hypothetical protein
MAPIHRISFPVLSAVVILAIAPSPCTACNIPVFRYALDRWAADPYRLTLFHRGPLDSETQTAIAALEKQTEVEFPAFTLDRIDLATSPTKIKGLKFPPADAELPWLVVRYPGISRINTPLWTGPLKHFPQAAFLDSPARQDIIKRIRSGDSAVWLLLASGDQAKDDATEKLLQAELSRLEKELKIPKRTSAPEDELVDEAKRPLRLAFSILRIDRNNADEAQLVKMLLNTDEDLAGQAEPMIFPVFGRGRALPALVGAGITAENIMESAAFLVGPCSCQVKKENPGVDLLLVGDWGVSTSRAGEAETAAIVGGQPVPLPEATSSAKTALPTEPSEPVPMGNTTNTTWPRQVLLAAIVAASLLVLLTGLRLVRRRRMLS